MGPTQGNGPNVDQPRDELKGPARPGAGEAPSKAAVQEKFGGTRVIGHTSITTEFFDKDDRR